MTPKQSSNPAIFISAMGATLFGILSQIQSTPPPAFDADILRKLESARTPMWDWVMLLISFIGKGWVTVTVVVIIVLWLLLRTNAKREAIFLAVVNIGSSIWSPLLKSFFDRPRPTPDIVASITSPSSASFPSGHAMSAMVFYASLALLARHVSPRLYPFAIALAAFMIPTMGFTRMYLGVHYPTDIIAGWAWGAAWVSFAYWVYRRPTN